MKKVKISIEGMSCENCEGHVKGELEEIGAKEISVSSADGSASVSVDDDVTEKQLSEAVEEAGYKATKVEFE